jgi:hypothetical protein
MTTDTKKTKHRPLRRSDFATSNPIAPDAPAAPYDEWLREGDALREAIAPSLRVGRATLTDMFLKEEPSTGSLPGVLRELLWKFELDHVTYDLNLRTKVGRARQELSPILTVSEDRHSMQWVLAKGERDASQTTTDLKVFEEKITQHGPDDTPPRFLRMMENDLPGLVADAKRFTTLANFAHYLGEIVFHLLTRQALEAVAQRFLRQEMKRTRKARKK